MKVFWQALFSLLLFLTLTLTGCSTDTEVKQEVNSTVTKVEKISQTADLNEIVDLGLMKMRIINISLVKNTDPAEDAPQGRIALGVEVGNVSNEDVFFNHGDLELQINTGETTTPDLTMTSDLGGNYPPQRVQQGFITFSLEESELSSVEELLLKIPLPAGKEGQSFSETEEVKISLKELGF